MSETPVNRCRLILALPPLENAAASLEKAIEGGDVACLFLAANGLDDKAFLDQSKTLVSLAQKHHVAAIIAGDTRIAGRAEADGILIEDGLDALKDATARFSPQNIVGCGGVRERHRALEAGEINPDFMFFGSLDRDIRPQPHKKNLALAEWWTEMVEIPCAVMGGNSLESVIDVALSGAEFVVLGKAVFAHEAGPGKAVSEANQLLDRFGPKFDEQ